MGNIDSQPSELVVFKRLPVSSDNQIAIPERPENRVRTNFGWTIFLIVVVILLTPFLIYTLCHAGTTPIKKNLGHGLEIILQYLNVVKWEIAISCAISVLLSIGMLFLFRHAVRVIVWGCLAILVVVLILIAAGAWIAFLNEPDGIALLTALAFTAVALIALGILVWLRKKIRLVIILLKEATNAIFDMPGLILVTVISAAIAMVLTIAFAITTYYLCVAIGRIPEIAYTTIALNSIVYVWLIQIRVGIHYMIIACGVAQWYFTRDKSGLNSPITTSTMIVLKYHVGTAVLGGFILTMIAVIKKTVLSLFQNERVRWVIRSCLESIESLLQFLSNNAYIITAMHGQPFIRSGKRAAKIIMLNLKDVIAINYIGDFVLVMVQVAVVLVTMLCATLLFRYMSSNGTLIDNFPGLIFVAIFSMIVVSAAVGPFEPTIDTLFICYCEDSLLNDGMEKPYFMSRNLMEFMQESKQIYQRP